MKNYATFLLLAGLLLPLALSSQHKQFVNPRNTWSFYTAQWFSPELYSHTRFSDKITVINGREYRQMLRESQNYPGWYGFGRYMREENGRVYSVNESQNEELVYDFTLEKGDSLVLQQQFYNTKMKVDSVNTIVTGDGLERKRLFLSLFCQGHFVEKAVWVEGIGDIEKRTFNPMSAKCIIADPETILTCFYIDNKPVLNDWGCQNNLEGYLNLLDWRYIWQVDRQVFGLPPSTRLYRFSGQKEINGKAYTQLFFADNVLPVSVPWSPSGMYFRYENGKLLKNADTSDYVIMDLSLLQGDSITINYHSSHQKIFILKTDTVAFKDNLPRKRLYLGCSPEDEPAEDRVWVYGLGDISVFLDYPLLQCSVFDPFERDNIVCILNHNYTSVYSAPGVQGCFKAGTGPEIPEKSATVTAYPNPASGLVTFSSEVPAGSLLTIRNTGGKTVLQKTWDASDLQLIADIEFLPTGLYIYSVAVRSGDVHSGKLLVR